MPEDWPSAEELRLEMTRDGWYMNVAIVEAALHALRRMLAEVTEVATVIGIEITGCPSPAAAVIAAGCVAPLLS